MIMATVPAVSASVTKVQMAFATSFIVGWSQINGKANGGTQSNVTTMQEVLQYQGTLLSTFVGAGWVRI